LKLLLYCSRPSRDLLIAAHQEVTVDWWENKKMDFDCYVSDFVIAEISKGDEKAIEKRLKAVDNIEILSENEEIFNLAQAYTESIELTKSNMFDAYHMACATIYKIDYLLTWNMTHIANPRTQLNLHKVNNLKGFITPFLVSIEEFMEMKYGN